MSQEMDKAYEPKQFEQDIYKKWEGSGYFHAEVDKSRKPFSIMMPPPNATGVLHLGHALVLSIQDAIIRYKRMQGFNAMWLPGVDHAAIATQTKVEKIMAKEGLTRHDLGREKFLERVREYVEQSKQTIIKQTKAMGSSCDWERLNYTFSDELSHAVNIAFARMFTSGLIYRGERIVNWCPRCHSTLADDEVEYQEQEAILYTFKYNHDFPISIATTRPETKLGDTAIAVNPEDKRYKKYIGEEIPVDFCGQKLLIKVIANDAVDMNFGTGALGVTPAHSQVDFEMAQKDGLRIIKVIDEDGKMNDNAGTFHKLPVAKAREGVASWLKKMGLMEKEEEIKNNLSICYRCGIPIEPLTSKQWFVNVNRKVSGWDYEKLGLDNKKKYSLKQVALKVVKDGQIKIMPKSLEKIYFNWMENLRDWCVSRQIWWGHQIPVWYKKKDGGEEEVAVSTESPGEGWERDQDTLDTWFSSALWTFSTLGWPDKTEDLSYFHPSTLMESGRDLVFFWIARMILMSTFLAGEIPFEKVYFHGMVMTKEGKKMSKSLGNAIDPIEMIDKYGTDALRLSVIKDTSPGIDSRFYEEKIIGQRNFVNKLWNVSRFIISNLGAGILGEKIDGRDINKLKLAVEDKWLLAQLDSLIENSTKRIDDYKFSPVIDDITKFVWHDLADWYLELVKKDLLEGSEERKKTVQMVLNFVLKNVLIVAHPFMPFVTEVVWGVLGKNDWGQLMVMSWPQKLGVRDENAQRDMEKIIEVVAGTRKKISDLGLAADKTLKLELLVKKNDVDEKLLKSVMEKILRNAKSIKIVKKLSSDSMEVVFDWIKVSIIADQKFQAEKMEAIKAELANLEKYAESVKKKLANEQFVKNAPKEVVDLERQKLASAEEKIGEYRLIIKN